MQLLEREDDLCDVDPDLVLGELFPLAEVREELAAVGEVQHDVELGRRLEGVVHRDLGIGEGCLYYKMVCGHLLACYTSKKVTQ